MSLDLARFAVVSGVDSADRVVTAVGEIDVYTGPHLRQALRDALQGCQRRLTVDMAGVSFMDSTGINALVTTLKQCRAAGVELAIRAPSRPVLRVLELSGLRAVVPVLDTAQLPGLLAEPT